MDSTLDFKLGSSEFLAFGARTGAGSPDWAAWIIECGLVRTVSVRFVHITGHLRLSVANIRANRGRRPFLYTEMELYGRPYNIDIYIYRAVSEFLVPIAHCTLRSLT